MAVYSFPIYHLPVPLQKLFISLFRLLSLFFLSLFLLSIANFCFLNLTSILYPSVVHQDVTKIRQCEEDFLDFGIDIGSHSSPSIHRCNGHRLSIVLGRKFQEPSQSSLSLLHTQKFSPISPQKSDEWQQYAEDLSVNKGYRYYRRRPPTSRSSGWQRARLNYCFDIHRTRLAIVQTFFHDESLYPSFIRQRYPATKLANSQPTNFPR